MYSFLALAFGIAAFAILALFNTKSWDKVRDSRAEVYASRMLIEHVCRNYLSSGNCPDGPYKTDDSEFGRLQLKTHKCTYTQKKRSEIPEGAVKLLIQKTARSYICVGTVTANRQFEIVGTQQPDSCVPPPALGSQASEIKPDAVVFCQKI